MNTATDTKPDPTADVLKEMLGENTGIHMLDSGGASGRHWQQNQGRDFDAEPEATMEIWMPHREGAKGSWSVTVNVYHFLKERLEYDPERTEALRKFGESDDMADAPWLACMEGWLEKLAKEKDIAGIYGEGEPLTVNTYNHDSMLSQVIQFTYWTEDQDGECVPYVALQIHGGADVRGGYTGPRVFRTWDTEIFDDAKGDMVCDNDDCRAGWWTDDAHHWYAHNDGPDLTDNVVAATEGDEGPREGVTYVTEDAIYCPCCGKGKLKPWAQPASC